MDSCWKAKEGHASDHGVKDGDGKVGRDGAFMAEACAQVQDCVKWRKHLALLPQPCSELEACC